MRRQDQLPHVRYMTLYEYICLRVSTHGIVSNRSTEQRNDRSRGIACQVGLLRKRFRRATAPVNDKPLPHARAHSPLNKVPQAVFRIDANKLSYKHLVVKHATAAKRMTFEKLPNG